MDFNATIDLIIKDLDDARSIIDDLKKYPGVPVLQIELAKAKCKSAGAVIALLKSMSGNIPEISETVNENLKSREPEINKESSPGEEQKLEIETPNSKPSVDDDEKKIDPVMETPPSVIENKEAVKKPRTAQESAIFADRFSHLSNRFNEQLGNQKGEDDISEIMKSKPLSNLPEAIGINDRFLFIREIFDGNKEAYNKAIMQLEKSKSLADARAVIMSYTDINDDNKAVRQLLDLVKRKLLSNE